MIRNDDGQDEIATPSLRSVSQWQGPTGVIARSPSHFLTDDEAIAYFGWIGNKYEIATSQLSSRFAMTEARDKIAAFPLVTRNDRNLDIFEWHHSEWYHLWCYRRYYFGYNSLKTVTPTKDCISQDCSCSVKSYLLQEFVTSCVKIKFSI